MSVEQDDEMQMQDISKATCKIASNTKGDNVTMRVSEGATKEIVDEVVNRAVAGWKKAILDVNTARKEIETEASKA